ncbi:MAG: ankyrin repeat domain-containing protein [Betaproteobacteria bacterium]|nr:ankyrin repeat domain-containing protein [Betaproteobacteria bacterium]
MKSSLFTRRFAIGVALTLALSVAAVVWTKQSQEIANYNLLAASSAGDLAAAALLLRRGAQINSRFGGEGQTALHRAAAQNEVQMVKFLLDHGADPNVADADGNTPLLVTAYKGHLEVALLLIAAKADLDVAESRYGITPLMEAARKGHVELVGMLLAAGANRASTTKDGRTARELALSGGNIAIAEMLASR